jgi:hypothetical protein
MIEILEPCPKCGKEGCTCDPETCECEPEIEELIADVNESKNTQKEYIQSFEE